MGLSKTQRLSILGSVPLQTIWRLKRTPRAKQAVKPRGYGCSTVALICFTCPAITVATVILRALDRVRGRVLGLLGSGSPKSQPHQASRDLSFFFWSKRVLSTVELGMMPSLFNPVSIPSCRCQHWCCAVLFRTKAAVVERGCRELKPLWTCGQSGHRCGAWLNTARVEWCTDVTFDAVMAGGCEAAHKRGPIAADLPTQL